MQNKSKQLRIFNDADRLKRILVNLISNSIKFTEFGEITVTISDEKDNPDLIRLEVTDTGTGIEPDKLEKLFKAYSTFS